MNNKEFLRTHQYHNPEGFLSRMDLLAFGDNKENIWQWVAKHYSFLGIEKILEVGCGTGDFWQFMKDKLQNQQLTLTDFSQGMLQVAKENIEKFKLPARINFQIADVENLPFEKQSFDIIFAHMMLYHAASQQKALNEIKRVLKSTGWLGISTFSPHHFQKILQLAHSIDPRISLNTISFPFSEEKADLLLAENFKQMKKYRYLSHLKINNVPPLLKVIENYPTVNKLNLGDSFFQQYALKAQDIINQRGAIEVDFNMVLYICSQEK